MRILAAADIHGSLEVYQWLIEQTGLADVFILAGDLFDADLEDQQRRQVAKIVKLLTSSNCPVYYIMGNDDNVALDYEDSLIRSLHDRRVELDGYNIVGYQYTPPFMGETFVKEDSEIAADLRLRDRVVDERTIAWSIIGPGSMKAILRMAHISVVWEMRDCPFFRCLLYLCYPCLSVAAFVCCF